MRRAVAEIMGAVATALVCAGLTVAAVYAVLAHTSEAPAVRKATSASAVWAYYGGVGWATDEAIACESAILIDQKTGVEYLMVQGEDGRTDVTLLVNADGSPKVAEE